MDYDDWNRALASKFYNPDQAHTPVYLNVDDECLREIARNHPDISESAREDFVRAVNRRVRPQDNRTQPFFTFLRWRQWERELKDDPATPPPFVGLLGLFVLAAGDMTSDDFRSVSSGNYYVRLNQLLGLSKSGCPSGFQELSRAWKRLNRWLEDDLEGRFGLPTAHNQLYGRYVGYPISQALMRRTDIEELPCFFRWCGLEPNEENVNAAFVRQQMTIWTSRTTCSFSKQLRVAFERERRKHIDAIVDMALAYYKTWDGTTTASANGSRTAEIIVQLTRSGRSFELSLHPRAPLTFPDGKYGTEALERVEGTEWFEPLSNGALARWLNGHAVDLQNDRFRLVLQHRKIVPLRSDLTSDLGGWLSCSRIRLGEQHRILSHASVSAQVEDYLSEHARDGWHTITSRSPAHQDWICFSKVYICDYAEVEQEELECLVPAKQVGIRFSGGLPLKRGVWLKGGEPEAAVSTDVAEIVRLDGVEIAKAQGGSTILDLRNWSLSEGSHVIEVGDRKASFAVSKSGNDLLRSRSLPPWGYPFQRASQFEFTPLSLTATVVPAIDDIPSGKLFITGVQVVHSAVDPPPPRQHLVILPYGARDYIILGRHAGEICQPELPTMLADWKAGEYLQGYKQILPFEPQWLISISHRGNETLRPLGHPQEALAEPMSGAGREEWLKWASQSSLKRRLSKRHRKWSGLWMQYNRVARSLR